MNFAKIHIAHAILVFVLQMMNVLVVWGHLIKCGFGQYKQLQEPYLGKLQIVGLQIQNLEFGLMQKLMGCLHGQQRN
jgi:hypothetical protein